MEARPTRFALLAATLLVSMGAQHRTPNFVINTPDPTLARQIGAAAERYRRDLAVEWLGKAMPDWSRPCTATVRVGANLGAGGETTFQFDRGEVYGWVMAIQGTRQRIFDSVLPHEITHMIFASHFRQALPRWADEGGATSVEHRSEQTKHRRMLHQFLRTGRGIPFDRMFSMTEYPRDVMPLYAQGFSLAEYLIQRGGKRKYVNFLADGLASEQWSAALRRHYGVAGAGALQNTWLAWVRQGSPRLASRQDQPAAVASADVVAVAGRQPREKTISLPATVSHGRPGAAPQRQAVLLDFYTDSCGPCREMVPTIRRLAALGFPVRKVNADEDPKLAAKYNVRAVPCFVMVVDGREVDRTVGKTDLARLRQMCVLAPAPQPDVAAASTTGLLANQDSRTTVLPASGWRAVGAPESAPPTTLATAEPASYEPIHSHVARPQPIEYSRQIILEWARDDRSGAY